MNDIKQCFRNQPEVPPQETSVEYELLETFTDMAIKAGTPQAIGYARATILHHLDSMHERGMSHRDRVDATRMVRLLSSLEGKAPSEVLA